MADGGAALSGRDAEHAQVVEKFEGKRVMITGATTILEVTADSKVVWQLSLKGLILERAEAAGRGFYKAERISSQKLAAAKAGG